MTSITIVGNLTDEPELRFLEGGAAVVKFSVAVNRRKFDRAANEWKDDGTSFYRVQAWRQLAENVVTSLHKGDRVIVQGEQEQRHWVDEKTNEKKNGWEVTAFAVGAELTWAAAEVTKTARGRQDAPADDPWNTAAKQRPAAAVGAAAAGYSDEPPF
ncbi:single-stranded DNA-binding protein [Streptomyces sp. NPDC005093]